jgi:hypothetical protein
MRKKSWSLSKGSVPTRESLGLEALESRTLLAGNVTASVINGTLTVLGDDANNAVQISTVYDPVYGDGFQVTGLDKDGPTTVNGNSDDGFFGVTNVYVDLKGGDDDLGVSNNLEQLLACLDGVVPEVGPTTYPSHLHIPGWAVLKMGDGLNRVGVGLGVTTGQRLLVQGGRNEDFVGICEVAVGANLVIQTFGGGDEVFVHDSESEGATRILTANGYSNVEVDGLYAEDLIIRGGYHNDEVYVQCVYVDDDVVIQTEEGYDTVGVDGCRVMDGQDPVPTADYWVYPSEIGDVLLIQTVDGGAKISVASVDAGRVHILGGLDRDYINLYRVRTLYNVTINTGDGYDSVRVSDVDVFTMSIVTGGASDSVFVGGQDNGTSNFRDDLIVVTNTGDDQVQIGERRYGDEQAPLEYDHVEIADDLVVDTGDGTDLIEVFGYDVGDNATIDAGAGDDSGHRMEDFDGFVWSWGGGVSIYDLDVFGNLNVFLGTGADSASIEMVYVGGNALVDAGAGDDGSSMFPELLSSFGDPGVRIRDLSVRNNFSLFLDTGYDEATVCGLSVGNHAFFYGGTEDDRIGLKYTHVSHNLYIYLGGGDDDLFLDKVSAQEAWLNGGGGDGDFYSQGEIDFGELHVSEIEFSVA